MPVSDLLCVLYVNNYGKCNIIQFLNEEGTESCKIHRRLCAVYGQGNVMAERNVYQWVEQFNKGWTTTHDENWSGRLSTT